LEAAGEGAVAAGAFTSNLLAHLAGGKSDRDEKTWRQEEKNLTGFATKFAAHKLSPQLHLNSRTSPPVTSLTS
jgi:hypothetical protein